MGRRKFLTMLALSGVLLSGLARKAVAQNAPKPPDLPPLTPLAGNGEGLPADWSFVEPKQWQTVERSLAAKMRLGLRSGAPAIDSTALPLMQLFSQLAALAIDDRASST